MDRFHLYNSCCNVYGIYMAILQYKLWSKRFRKCNTNNERRIYIDGCDSHNTFTESPINYRHVLSFVVFVVVWYNSILPIFFRVTSPVLECHSISQGPLARYVKLRVAHALGISGTFSPPPQVSDPDMHHGMCVTRVPWCIPGSLTSGFLWSRWRWKRSRRYRRMRNPQFYVSGKRRTARDVPLKDIGKYITWVCKNWQCYHNNTT